MNPLVKCLGLWGLLVATAVAYAEGPAVPAGKYQLDETHSTIVFRVSHLGFSFYTASFSRFDASLSFDPEEIANSSLQATIDIASLTIPAPPEGFHDTLLGPDWFDAQRYPTMTYQSTAVEKTGPNTARVTGDLTLKGATHPVVLEVVFNGGYAGFPELDPNARAGFSARGMLQRSDFNMAIGIPEKGSSLGVGDSVEFAIETEFTGPPLPPE